MEETMVYTVKEVAEMLHTSPNYIYKIIDITYIHRLCTNIFMI